MNLYCILNTTINQLIFWKPIELFFNTHRVIIDLCLCWNEIQKIVYFLCNTFHRSPLLHTKPIQSHNHIHTIAKFNNGFTYYIHPLHNYIGETWKNRFFNAFLTWRLCITAESQEERRISLSQNNRLSFKSPNGKINPTRTII